MIAVVDYHKGNLMSVLRGLEAAGGDALITDDADVIARADAVVLPGVGAFADASSTMSSLGQLDVVRERIRTGVPFLGICLGMHLMFEEGEEGAPDGGEDENPRRPKGLAVLPGVVGRMARTDEAGVSYKIPHVGWNSVEPAYACGETLLDAACEDGDAEGYHGEGCGESRSRSDSPARAKRPQDVSARAELALCATPRSSSDSKDGLFASPLFEGIEAGEFFYFTHSFCVPEGPFAIARTTHAAAFPCAVQYGDAAFGVQFHPEKSSDAGARVLRNFVTIAKGV